MDKSFILALCSLVVTLISIIATNLAVFWAKRLDIFQKTNDHKLAVRTLFLTNKLKAAENAISKWSVAISYYTALEQFLQSFDPEITLLDEFTTPVESQLAKLQEAVYAASSEGTAFLLYFEVIAVS